MSELSALYPRYGYRRIAIVLARDGHRMSFGRAHGLWRQARLQVSRKRPGNRVATGRPRPNAPTGANQVWSLDFVFDWCASGQQLKCLTVTDAWTKEGLAIEVDGRIRSGRVIEVLSRLVTQRGAAACLRCDNGPEFVSLALLKWIVGQGIETASGEQLLFRPHVIGVDTDRTRYYVTKHGSSPYHADRLVDEIAASGAGVDIPPRRSRKVQRSYDTELHEERNRI